MNNLDRKLDILTSIVEQYIFSGNPVGSKTVSKDLEQKLSSATIRNEMADLVCCGYLLQPHISSGRIPSFQGYRLYISKSMNKKPLSEDEKFLIEGALSSVCADPEGILNNAAKVLSDMTHCTVAITTPPSEMARIRDIRFVRISRRNAMIVVVMTNGMVKNKLFRCDYEINDELLNMFRSILIDKFKGECLRDITPELVNIMVGNDNDLTLLLLPVIDVFLKAAREAREVEVKTCGHRNLLSIPGMTSETIINIFDFLECQKEVFDLFSSGNCGVNFIIGDENKNLQLKNASVAYTHYNVGGKSGAIGVIGPTRMNYAKIASQLEYVASLIGVLFGRLLENS